MIKKIIVQKLIRIFFFFCICLLYFSCGENATQEIEELTVKIKSSEKSIYAFTVTGQTEQTQIDQTQNTITVTVPFETDISKISPYVEIPVSAKVFPESRKLKDFSNTPQEYVVTAEDGSSKTYSVIVIKEIENLKNIVSFKINGQIGVEEINEQAKVIKINLPIGYIQNKLIPMVSISPGATISPAIGATVDFTLPVIYTVTGSDNKFKRYTVIVNKERNVCAFSYRLLEYGGKHYELIREPRSFEEAETCAKERGGYLVNINSAEENEVIKDFLLQNIEEAEYENTTTFAEPLFSDGSYVWIGADEQSAGGTYKWNQDTDPFWASGSEQNNKYSNWARNGLCFNEPSGAGIGLKAKVAMFLRRNTLFCNNEALVGKWVDIIGTNLLFKKNVLYYIIEYEQTY